MSQPENNFVDNVIRKLEASMPLIFSRKEAEKLLGKTVSSGTLANAASADYGPPFIRNGRSAIYERQSFLSWYSIYLRGGIKAVKIAYGSK